MEIVSPIKSPCRLLQGSMALYVSTFKYLVVSYSETLLSCRVMEYICGENSSACDYSVFLHNPREKIGDPALGDWRILPSPYPLTTGRLKICKTLDFRKTHRKLNPGYLKCSNVIPKRVVMPESIGR